MDYVRTHIKRYWGMVYRRTFGIALVTVSIVLSMGLTFGILRGALAISSYIDYLLFWLILAVIAVATIVSSFFHSHVTSVRFMNEVEHRSHSKYTAIWLVSLIIGIVAFIFPLLMARPVMEPIVLLFTSGGIMMVLYFTIRTLFKHSYAEFVIAGIAFWVMFIFGLFQLSGSTLSYSANIGFTLYYSAMSITVISGFTGITMLINSTRDSLGEFSSAMVELDKKLKSKTVRARRTRRRRRR